MERLVIFSGAGMSAESGISTFRDSGGLWEKHRVEDVATPQAWIRNPELVQDFYNQRRKQILESGPNEAHAFIAELQKHYELKVVTQNIDDLHERAGCIEVCHLHGEIRKAKSSGPNSEKQYFDIEGWELSLHDKCPEGYPLRPHVVWFGEPVPMLETASRIIRSADILIVIGTSLQVYPAASLIHDTKPGCERVIIDPKAGELNVPDDFSVLQCEASRGLKNWHEKRES